MNLLPLDGPALTLLVIAVLLAFAYLVDAWPDAQASGSRSVALAQASTSGQSQNAQWSRFNTGWGNPSRGRPDQVVTVFRSTPSRSAIC